jgi:hypothetical protein
MIFYRGALAIALAVCVILPISASAKEHRSTSVKREFQLTHPCPATGLTSGPCPGYVKDHVVPLTDRPHQEVSTELVNAATAVEADDAVTTGKQDHECARSLSSEEEHPLGPAGDR